MFTEAILLGLRIAVVIASCGAGLFIVFALFVVLAAIVKTMFGAK